MYLSSVSVMRLLCDFSARMRETTADCPARQSALGANLFYQRGGGITLDKRDGQGLAAIGFDHGGLGELLHVVVAALDQDVGLDLGNQRQRGVLIKPGDQS